MTIPPPITEIPKLLRQFGEGPQLLRAAVAGMNDEQIQAKPLPGAWSTLEVVCHLVDFEIVYAARLQRILAELNPTLLSADPDHFSRGLHYADRQLHEELAVMDAVRRQTTRIFQSLAAEDWNRPWVHSTDGALTLADLLQRITGHVPHHVGFIYQKRRALGLADHASQQSSSDYLATIHWVLAGSGFLKGQYSREHTWTFDGGLTVPASPSPHVVPAPWSNPALVDPEEALVAAIASCHMLTFLWLASKAGIVVTSYSDTARGVMTKNDRRIPWVSSVTLQPQITWGGERIPTDAEVALLHEQAHAQCFIANSVLTKIQVLT